MPNIENGDWVENKKFVLNALEDLAERFSNLDVKLDTRFRDLEAKLQPIALDINGLKVKAGVVGFLAGLIAPFITLMFMFFKQLFSNP
jgi:hypothetical protein